MGLFYPSSPLFLLYSPELVKALTNFIFHYSESGKRTFLFPAHDVGTYPVANGQTFVGDMPVEEAGNMLILTDAICKAEGAADYVLRHWEVLSQWADYLVKNGLDPADQFCTDDFAGRFPRNVNLSAKAVLAVAAYADLVEMTVKADPAQKYATKARDGYMVEENGCRKRSLRPYIWLGQYLEPEIQSCLEPRAGR